MSSGSLHSRTASNGSLADDDSMPDAGQPSCPSSPASMDGGPRLAAARTAGMGSLISRLNSQNLWLGAEDDRPDPASAPAPAPAPAPQSPSDVSMPDLDGQEETAQQAAAHETPESILDLQGLSRDQHLRLMRRSGPADKSRVLSLLEDMVAQSRQCNVRRPPLARTAAPRPTATMISPSTDTTAAAPSSAAASISATETPTPTPAAPAVGSSADGPAAAPTAASAPPPPPPARPQPLPGDQGGCGETIEVDSAEEDGEESWQRWQKERETAALLRAAKTPAGIRKNGLARMHYTSQDVALRCPNVILSRPRMRKRRKTGEDPAKTSGRGAPASRASAPPPTQSAAVPSASSASNVAPDPHVPTATS